MIGIAYHQRLDLRRARVTEIGAREDLQRAGAQRVYLRLDLRLRAFAQRNHGHHRGHADDDAEHGQQGAQAMGQHRTHRHARRLAHGIDAGAPLGSRRGCARRCVRTLPHRRASLLAIRHHTPIGDLDHP